MTTLRDAAAGCRRWRLLPVLVYCMLQRWLPSVSAFSGNGLAAAVSASGDPVQLLRSGSLCSSTLKRGASRGTREGREERERPRRERRTRRRGWGGGQGKRVLATSERQVGTGRAEKSKRSADGSGGEQRGAKGGAGDEIKEWPRREQSLPGADHLPPASLASPPPAADRPRARTLWTLSGSHGGCPEISSGSSRPSLAGRRRRAGAGCRAGAPRAGVRRARGRQAPGQGVAE